MTVYDFHQQLRQGQQGETTVHDWLRSQGWNLRPATMPEQKQGIDFWGSKPGRGAASFEVKTDTAAHRTLNAFVELQSNSKTGKLGWLFTCQADVLLYWIPKMDTLHWMNLTAIRTAYADWKELYPIKTVHNGTYYTTGLVVPLEVFETCAIYTYHLNPIPPAA